MTKAIDFSEKSTTARPSGAPVDASSKHSTKHRLRPLLMLGVPALLAVIGYCVYVANARFVVTDNAYARVAKASINARISGQVTDIAVSDNQAVRKGQVLFSIDSTPFQIAVDRAEAQLGSSRLRIDGLKAGYRQQLAELQSAKASAEYDQKEFARKKALIATDFVSRAAFERADTDFKIARQRIAAIEQQIASSVAALDGDPDIAIDSHPTVREAKAELDQAQLNLSYTTVTAPADGRVAKVDDLQVGNYVNGGAAVFALISDREVWVEANFRETQLTHMHPGQPATITLDTYPDRQFDAHVISLSPGAGADFALLPPENATGNWVKVVQRVPVRLELDELDPALPLFSGTSATVKVDTGQRISWWQPLASLFTARNG